MSNYKNGETVTFKFIFSANADFYDPIVIDQNWNTRDGSATPYYGSGQNDILIYVLKGENGGGGVADGPFSYNTQSSTPDYGIPIQQQFQANQDIKNKLEYSYITRESEGVYNFVYKIPDSLFPGKYTVVLETNVEDSREIRELNFYVKDSRASGLAYINSKLVANNLAIFTTTSTHGLKVGEIISISGVDNYSDGVDTVSEVLSTTSFAIATTEEDSDKRSINPTAIILKDKSADPVIVASQPFVAGGGTVSPIFRPLQPFATNSVLLIGHGDSNTLQINQLKRIQSIQDAINTLNGNTRSPLLRAVIDCYNAGCDDIYIMISAPMSEYVDDFLKVNTVMPAFLSTQGATPATLTFYEKYYERLNVTYEIAQTFDFIDIVVPVSTSFIRTNNVNFVRQLVNFCKTFYTESSTMVYGIIGSRTNGANAADVATISDPSFLSNLLKDEEGNNPTEVDVDGNVLDVGKHAVLVYGEAVFTYPNMGLTYTSNVASTVAGQLSNWPVYLGLNRKVLKGAYSSYGIELNSLQVAKLHNSKVNCLIKSNRSRRALPFQVLISDDKTLAKNGSSFANIPQVRLVAMVMNEILSIVQSNTGKFAYDTIKEKTIGMFEVLKNSSPSILRDYRFEMYADKKERGKVYMEIDLISSHALKKISFGILAGPGA
jgi:hypothetical protein